MPVISGLVESGELPEEQFAAHVGALTAAAAGRDQLTDLLREDHPVYAERSSAEVVRMRGWLLIVLARVGVGDSEVAFVLEELDSGTDSYLVAAAAFALRSYSVPLPVFGPFLMRSIANIRFRDTPVCLTEYGEYVPGVATTTAVQELLTTLAWMGAQAVGVEADIRQLISPSGGLSRKYHDNVRSVLSAIERARVGGDVVDSCCAMPSAVTRFAAWVRTLRGTAEPVGDVLLQDEMGHEVLFRDFFRDRPTIVAFFYTRCDNPLKCSLTISKLAQIQIALDNRGLYDQIQTVAITYDPEYDSPARLSTYARDRGLGPSHRLLRTTSGFQSLRAYFQLGVNFIDSLVNRHRIELYIVDDQGRVAASFHRLHWSVEEVVDRAVLVLGELNQQSPSAPPPMSRSLPTLITPTLSTLAVAFFPKCPICWAAYLSAFGIAGLEEFSYPWLWPALVTLMIINIICLWKRSVATCRRTAFLIAMGGMLLVLMSRFHVGWQAAAPWGIAATFLGVGWCVLPTERSPNPLAADAGKR